MKKAPEIDAPAGIETKIHVEDEKLVFERVADLQPILDQAADLRSGGFTKTGMGDYHVAKIPALVIEKYCNQVGITFHEFCVNDQHVTRILNDPDYKLFRVWEGRA